MALPKITKEQYNAKFGDDYSEDVFSDAIDNTKAELTSRFIRGVNDESGANRRFVADVVKACEQKVFMVSLDEYKGYAHDFIQNCDPKQRESIKRGIQGFYDEYIESVIAEFQ